MPVLGLELLLKIRHCHAAKEIAEFFVGSLAI